MQQPSAPRQPAPERLRDGGGFSWMLAAGGFFFLTFNSVMVVYDSKGDGTIISLVATSYLDLVLLCFCICLYEKTAPGSSLRNRLKASVWALTTLLTFSFAYMAMGMSGLTLPVALLAWIMAAATGIGAFSAFFERGRMNQMPDATVRPPV